MQKILGLFAISVSLLFMACSQGSKPCGGIEYANPPAPQPPFPSRQALCAADHGKPIDKELIPPVKDFSEASAGYVEKLKAFLIARDYDIRLGWLHDLTWRLTGEYEGCPTIKDGAEKGESFGVHPAVKIYYSPEVIDWLCKDREGDLPDGAMIVKEMHEITNIGVDKDNKMWLPETHYKQPGSWTIMVKKKDGSVDGWYWGNPSPTWIGNPPIIGRSAVTTADFFADPQKLVEHDAGYYPTGNSKQEDGKVKRRGSAVYPYNSFGNYCINCHASAISESTFSSLDDILTYGHRYEYRGLGTEKSYLPGIHDRHGAVAGADDFADPLPEADPQFLQVFSQLPKVGIEDVLESRLPAETYDHAVAREAGGTLEQFVTSDQCLGCHDATGNIPNMVFKEPDGTLVNLSPYSEWRASPMGLAGRDPIFFSQLESERNLLSDPYYQACIENTCLHCHGVNGQRQLTLDTTPATGGLERCADLMLPGTKAKTLFRRSMMDAWPQGDAEYSQYAKYGGLGRDGISCATCHHISDQGLGKPETFTGNFHVGPPDKLYGPFEDDVKAKPMEQALGITPEYKAHMKSAEVCGSCHAIELPVFDENGKPIEVKFEQTTYLEWLNSDFAGTGKAENDGETCQDCHMPDSFHDKKLSYKIANIEDETYPETDNRLPDDEITLKKRDGFARHKLYGLNVFLNEMFQQFPVILGIRQLDYMISSTRHGLLTARDSVLEVARDETADLDLEIVSFEDSLLKADVTVTNKTGHHFPSGVGFRRAFVEFVVLDDQGKPLWASGRTSKLGVILNGVTDKPLPSEFFSLETDGTQAYQHHHQKIDTGAQVQIYEELVKNTQERFTTSFLHRAIDVKDNRLRPRGWRSTGLYAKETKPHGDATKDPDYKSPDEKPLTGSDAVRYQVQLSPDQSERARSVRATLYYQSIPPYYLAQRFEIARKGPANRDTKRLYYLTSHLNVQATDGGGQPFIKDWKLRIASQSKPLQR